MIAVVSSPIDSEPYERVCGVDLKFEPANRAVLAPNFLRLVWQRRLELLHFAGPLGNNALGSGIRTLFRSSYERYYDVSIVPSCTE